MQQLNLSIIAFTLLWSVFLFTGTVRSDSASVVISEIGAYEGTDEEWIEVVNVSDSPVDLTDWKFWEADTNHGLTLISGSMTLAPDAYAVITQNDVAFVAKYPDVTATIIDSSWGTINEGGEVIGLKNAAGEMVEEFTYIAAPDTSLERVDLQNTDYTVSNWIAHPDGNSAGEQNFWYEESAGDNTDTNTSPIPVIVAPVTSTVDTVVTFDGTDSTDSDGTIDSYNWHIDESELNGVVVEYTFTTSGTYPILLTVTDDDGAVASTTVNIEMVDVAPTSTPADGAPTTTEDVLTDLLINEFMPNPATGTEWIELYNSGTSTVDLDGWTLSDGVGTIASPTGTIAVGEFIILELAASKLNNGGDVLILSFGTSTIDSIAYGSWEDANVDDPEKGNSLARDGDVFKKTTTPTKGEENIITPPEGESSPSSGGGGSSPATEVPAIIYTPRDVVINELVSDPTDGADEFIELYNTTKQLIALDGWYLLDGSEAKTSLAGTIAPGGFIVVEEPKGNLNNSGDIVQLFDPTDQPIDSVTYGDWDDGNLADNAQMADDPASLARLSDGQDSDYDLYDFAVTHTISPGKANIIASVEGEFVSADGAVILRGNIILSEVFPNPVGSDAEGEFIELYNAGETDVSLDEWKLGDASKSRYTFAGTTIAAGEYLLFSRTDTGLALNNSGGEEVNLYNPAGDVIDSTTYSSSAAEGESYARDGSDWNWTSTPTPGEKNSIEASSQAPQIVIDVDQHVRVGEFVQFDASDTVDSDSDELSFAWEFGDGGAGDGDVVEHVYIDEGIYIVTLIVSDEGGNTSEQEVIVTAKHSTTAIGDVAVASAASSVQISEFIPNPEGSDTTEFIELYNPTSEMIDLTDLKLDDEEGGSRAYAIPAGTVIEPGEYLIFGKQDTKIALNNTNDSVRLMYPNGTIIAAVDYDGSTEGSSYAMNEEGNWIWTGTPTPGNPNIVSVPTQSSRSRSTSKRSNYAKPVIETTLEFIRSEDIGDVVTVTGVVAVEPGVLGSQYFYIVGSPGVQVYMYKKDFPDLKIGDRVRVTGEISEALGETRLKLSERADIEIIDHVGMPTPTGIDISEIGEPFEGWLIGVDGEITEVKSNYMYVDDGTGEVRVYFKRGANIPSATYEVGELVRVIGIVSQTKSGYQLLPRSSDDITTTGMATSAVIEKQQEKEAEQEETIEKYLTATAGGLTSIILGLGIKEHGGKMRVFMLRLFRRFRRKK